MGAWCVSAVCCVATPHRAQREDICKPQLLHEKAISLHHVAHPTGGLAKQQHTGAQLMLEQRGLSEGGARQGLVDVLQT